MSHDVGMVNRETLASPMTCQLCHKLFRDATTVVECLHTFCRKCIYKKLLDEEMESCPVCKTNLGCTPLNMLRSDNSLQTVRDKTFPSKIIKVKAAEMVTPITLPAKRKERTLSPLVIGTPRDLTKTGSRRRESKPSARKTSRGSSSMEVLNKDIHTTKQNSSDDHNFEKGEEKTHQALKGKVGSEKLLNCSEPGLHKKLKRGCNQAMVFGEPTIPHHVVPEACNAQIGPINRPIWFSLVASDIKEGNNSPLPQISVKYIRIKDGRMPVSCIKEYLKSKLGLTNEDEVEIKCMGQRVCPTSTLNNLMEMFIKSSSGERVSITIGASASNFVMVLSYARGFPDLNKAPPTYLTE